MFERVDFTERVYITGGLAKVIKLLTLFFIGALGYGTMEVMTRGFTHISMGLLGGLSFLFISFTSVLRRGGSVTLLQQLIVITLFITAAELICGLIINLNLGLAIWDYTDMPLNFMGQICLPFSILWFGISYLGIIAEEYVSRRIFKEPIAPLPIFKRAKA